MRRVINLGSKSCHPALWCVVLAASWAFAGSPKISKDLQQQSSDQWVNVIVQYRVPPSSAQYAKVVVKGGAIQQNLPVINAAALTIKRSSLAALASEPDVVYVSLDRTVSATATVTDFYDQA